ncbi:MAG: DUF2169 domain-containing protein [Sandaracinaceae bacterium]
MSRAPARADYDAIVDALPFGEAAHEAFGLVKRTYTIGRRGIALTKATPLFHDLRDPNVMPRLVPGCEFYPFKRRTDVVVRGHAFAKGGTPTPERTIALAVGDRMKMLDVIGRRTARWEGGRPRFGDPEPFVRMPVSWREAYGGVDPRLPFDATRGGAHPGVYPRNPLGKGYVVLDASTEIELPNLEDPSRRLTEALLVVGDPSRWWQQPLPWCFEYTLPLMFPRRQWLGPGAMVDVPTASPLEEVRRGFLRRDFREASALVSSSTPSDEFYQEAPFGQTFDPLAPGTVVAIEGMTPDRDNVTFEVPSAPAVEIRVRGQAYEVPTLLGTLLVEPGLGRASFVWIARLERLPHPIAAGPDRVLPLSIRVDGDEPIAHAPPAGFVAADVTERVVLPVDDPDIPITKQTVLPEAAQSVITGTLVLNEAQLRGDERVPMSEDTRPRVPLSLADVLGADVGVDLLDAEPSEESTLDSEESTVLVTLETEVEDDDGFDRATDPGEPRSS